MKLTDAAQLEELCTASAISRDVLARARVETIEGARDAGKLTKRPPDAWAAHLPAIGFPYRFPDDPSDVVGWSLKGRTPLESPDGKPVKYVRPKGFSRPFLPPDLVEDGGVRLDDPKIPKLITEGEKKALSASSAGFACIAIPGVQNWGPGKKARALGAPKKLDSVLERAAKAGSEFFIAFDGDRTRNAWVAEAEQQLATALTRAGARVFILKLAGDGPKGLDDYLAANGAQGPAQLQALIERARRVGPVQVAPDESNTLDELATAQRFVAEHGRDIAFCAVLGGWYAWDGKRWTRDEAEETRERAKRLAEALRKEAAEKNDNDLWKHARKMASDRGVNAVLNLARSAPAIVLGQDEIDADPWLLNTLSGTVDLRTGKLRDHDRADRCTKLAPVRYAEDATAPAFAAFIEQILPDHEVLAFVWRFLGYACTGAIREHALPVFHGTGANGKSTLVEIVMTILGGYAQPAPREIFLARQGEGHPTEVADLMGARLVVASETGEGRRLDEAKVKALTGGDRIRARYMRKDFFTFVPTHKAVLLTNHRPRVRGTDNGIWRRLALVPFTVTIPEARQDKALKERILATEASGVLRWLIAGCMAWQQKGLAPPDAVRAATQEYRSEEDDIGRFLRDRCVVGAGTRVRAKDLYEAYTSWCSEQGLASESQTKFGRTLGDRADDFEKKPDGYGITWYHGIGLRSLTYSDGDVPHNVVPFRGREGYGQSDSSEGFPGSAATAHIGAVNRDNCQNYQTVSTDSERRF